MHEGCLEEITSSVPVYNYWYWAGKFCTNTDVSFWYVRYRDAYCVLPLLLQIKFMAESVKYATKELTQNCFSDFYW